MAERQKKPQRAKRAGTTRARSSAPVLGQQLTLERRVVELLELLHVLSANAQLCGIDARLDEREPARDLATTLAWLSKLGANTSEPVQALNAFLEKVGVGLDEPDACSCAHCGAPCWRKSFNADERCTVCRHGLKSGQPMGEEASHG